VLLLTDESIFHLYNCICGNFYLLGCASTQAQM
ncbi:unnamed protein product, partial [Onchocerca ochengi]